MTTPFFQLRAVTALIVLLGTLSAALVATVDAATIASRLQGEAVTERAFWMYAFAVSIMTVIAGVGALWVCSASWWVRTLLAWAALVNMSVSIVSFLVVGGGWLVPAMYFIAAVSLGVVARAGVPLHRRHLLQARRRHPRYLERGHHPKLAA